MSSHSRREFLKLMPLLALPLLQVRWPHLAKSANDSYQQQDTPNILILVFDTVSAKHVSLYGYNRETTPNLARFAERSTVYHSHYAGANFTSPGTASLLTGTYPWSHRAFHLHGTVDDRFIERNLFSLTPDNYYKIAYTHNLLVYSLLHQFRGNLGLLKQVRDLCLLDSEFADRIFPDDFSTAFWGEWLFLRGGNTPPSSLFLSLTDRGRRFVNKRTITKEYGQLFPRGIPNLHSLFFILEDAIEWLKAEMKGFQQPFLGYFHFLPPHEPYATRRDFVDVFRDNWKPSAKPPHFASEGHSDQFLNKQRREYDEYLAYADAEFGRLLDFMEQSGLLDNMYLILTSDHGELFERGIRGHVTPTLYEPLIRVPLLISKPGQHERQDVHTPTSCVDVLPTLLHLTGQAIPDWCEGEILPTFASQEGNNERVVFAVEAKSNPKHTLLTKATIVIVKNQYKLINYLGYGNQDDTVELYNLANDPEELEDLYPSKPVIAADLKDQLVKQLQRANQSYL